MSILASDVINRARAIWKETASGDLLSDPNALLFLSDGLLELRGIRADLFRDSEGERQDHVDVTTLGQTISVDVDARPILVDYVVARGFMADADSQNHETRANNHFKLFARVKE